MTSLRKTGFFTSRAAARRRPTAVLLGLVLIGTLWPLGAQAVVTLATSTAPRFEGGSVRCSGVNVGDEPVDIRVTLIDVATGQEDASTYCADENDDSDEDVVEPGQRCTVVSSSTAIVWCKIEIDIAGGSGDVPNPTLALLRERVRANVTSTGGGTFVVLEAR